MILAKIVVALLIAPVFSEEAYTSKGGAVDDATSLFQSQDGMRSTATGAKPIGMYTKGIAEFIAMTLFVFIGCGTAMSVPDKGGKLFHVSVVFGFAITALAYSIGHYSGGQINCAVTFGLYLVGNITATQGVVNLIFQLLGAIFGSYLTTLVFSEETDCTKPNYLGTNFVQPGFSWWQAFVGEFFGTFLLVYVVLETAVNPDTFSSRPEACIAIGFAVFLAHCVLIPVDGCSINPSRSFGPMVMRKIFRQGGKPTYVSGHWIFWLGPLSGAAFATALYRCMHQHALAHA